MKALLLLIFIISVNAQARELGLLEDIHAEYNSLYQTLGGDNNVIEKIYFTHNDLTRIKDEMKRHGVVIKKMKKSKEFAAIKRCLFMKRGAYGQHLNIQGDQDFLTKRFLKSLKKNFIVAPTLYYVDHLELEIVTNSCGILVVGTRGHEAIIMQSGATD